MSYDITFKAKLDGLDEYVIVGDCDANITCNVREIITLSTGLPWMNYGNNGKCVDVIPHIDRGRYELVNYTEKYIKYEPSNGWGCVANVIVFFDCILDAWRRLRREYPEIAKVATFWIE